MCGPLFCVGNLPGCEYTARFFVGNPPANTDKFSIFQKLSVSVLGGEPCCTDKKAGISIFIGISGAAESACWPELPTRLEKMKFCRYKSAWIYR